MKKLFMAFVMLVFIMGTTYYCLSAENATPKKAPKAKTEQMGGAQKKESKTTTSIQVGEDEPKADEPSEEQGEEF